MFRVISAELRPYTAEKYSALVDRIRAAKPEVAITSDIIVGFPGEQESDYSATRELVEHVQFDNAFIFRYSTRADTPAATMPDQVPESVKEARNQDLLRVVDQSAHRANERYLQSSGT